MQITPTTKGLLLVSLVLLMIISYLINNQQAKPPLPDQSAVRETADEYNKRKKEEVTQAIKKRASKVKDDEANAKDGRKVTIDAFDPATGDIIDPINLWGNYGTRTIAGKLKHGETVTMIRREGDGVFIQKKSGLRGWVTYFFIKEFNEEAKKRGDK